VESRVLLAALREPNGLNNLYCDCKSGTVCDGERKKG